VWVIIHDLLHRALREEGAQLTPQALPLLARRVLGSALHPRVPRQAVALSVIGLPPALLLQEAAMMCPVMWRQSGAGGPRRLLLVARPRLMVAAPALAAGGAFTWQRAVLMRVVTSPAQAGPLGVPAEGP